MEELLAAQHQQARLIVCRDEAHFLDRAAIGGVGVGDGHEVREIRFDPVYRAGADVASGSRVLG